MCGQYAGSILAPATAVFGNSGNGGIMRALCVCIVGPGIATLLKSIKGGYAATEGYLIVGR